MTDRRQDHGLWGRVGLGSCFSKNQCRQRLEDRNSTNGGFYTGLLRLGEMWPVPFV